jgi:sortase A
MRAARVLGGIGRTLIAAGVLILLFVAYQLWGTGLREAQAQNRLENQFEERLREVEVEVDEPPVGETTTTTAPPPRPEIGSAAANIVIERIGVNKIVVEGFSLANLKDGPGHHPDTPMPGQPGNVAIAGHRTTYGAPFNRIDELMPGDPIVITTLQGTFRYEVMDEEGDGNGNRIVRPSEVEVLEDKGDNRVTLIACHPKYSARQRIVVTGRLVVEPAPPPPPADPEVRPVSRTLDVGLDGEGSSAWPAVWFALACAAVWVLAWLVGRRWRKWPSYAIGTLPFLVLLFFFFENFARLLPANF